MMVGKKPATGKLVILVLTLAVLNITVSSYVTATLNFTETFESYNLNNETWYTATSVWSCPAGTDYKCSSSQGTPPATANATQYIATNVEGGKYLYLSAYNNDNNGGKKVRLYGNFTSSAYASFNWSVNYDIKYFSSTWSTITGWTSAQRRSRAGLNWENFAFYSGRAVSTSIGGAYNASDQDDFERLRILHDTSGANDGSPDPSLCDVNDGYWHRVTLHFIYNPSTLQYDETDVYIDGASCLNFTTNLNRVQTAGGNSYKLVVPEAVEGFTVGIDNIKVYYNELVTPTAVGNCSDGIDNDGDGYTDYPYDPSCSSEIDTSESPRDDQVVAWFYDDFTSYKSAVWDIPGMGNTTTFQIDVPPNNDTFYVANEPSSRDDGVIANLTTYNIDIANRSFKVEYNISKLGHYAFIRLFFANNVNDMINLTNCTEVLISKYAGFGGWLEIRDHFKSDAHIDRDSISLTGTGLVTVEVTQLATGKQFISATYDDERDGNTYSVSALTSDVTVDDPLHFVGFATHYGQGYSYGLDYINISVYGNGTTVSTECSDGTDNDGDGYTDYPNDPSCSSASDTTESPYDYTECNDGVDNDGDGYTDYPTEPSCSSLTDDSEAPVDVPQCNDGIDNDLDGFIDYGNDPSCSSAYDNDESPKDASISTEDDCYESLFCLIHDTVPYNDDFFLHGWWGQKSDAHTSAILGGWSIMLDTVDSGGVKEYVRVYKNISHVNNYNDLEGEFDLSILPKIEYSITDEPVSVGFYDYNDNPMAYVVLNITTDSSVPNPYDAMVKVYAYDGSGYKYFDTAYLSNSESGFLTVYFYLDEHDDTYRIKFTDSTGTTDYSPEYDYNQVSFGQVYYGGVENTITTNETNIYLHTLKLYGSDTDENDTVCTTWDLPYHLKENFNGYLSECDWNIDPDIFFYGTLVALEDFDSFTLYRIFDTDPDDAIYYDNSRYATVKFDFTPVSSQGDTIMDLYLYDLAMDNAFIRLSFGVNGTVFDNVKGESSLLYSNLTLNSSASIQLVLDLLEDTYDFYVGGVKQKSAVEFYDSFVNIEYFNGIYFRSENSEWYMDNLEVYTSEPDGDKASEAPTPDDEDTPVEGESMCGLFNDIDITCASDSDCPTGKCQVNNKCARFDYNYCDDNNYLRGNMCVLSGVTNCALTSLKDMIFDNFFLFLVGLILLMGLVYLAIMFKQN